MSKRSIHTEAVQGVLHHMDRLREDVKGKQAPPLMMESVTARDEANRVAKMSPAERQAWIDHVGIEHAVEVAGRLSKKQAGA